MFTTKINLRSALFLGAATAAALSFSATSYAQATETVIVTGSRIPTQTNLTSVSPVAVVSGEQLKDLGVVSVETMLNTLPQFEPSLTMTSNNPQSGAPGTGAAAGEANLDLRGLGSQRTLILVDGRRLMPASASGVVDVNMIPTSLVDHIDIVTGGASAVYGSDAVGGVVNFILKRDFEGAVLEGQYGVSELGDGQQYQLAGTIGINSANGRGNLTLNAGYDSRAQVLQGDRAFSNASRAVGTDYNIVSGSGTIPNGRYDVTQTNKISQAAINTLFATYGLAAGSATNGHSLGFNANGTLFDASTGAHFLTGGFPLVVSSPAVTYNFGAVNNLIIPYNRYNVFADGHYDVFGDKLVVFMQALFTETNSHTQLAPTPATGLTVPVTNPYIPAAFATLLASRATPAANFVFRKRFVENGPRIEDDTQTAFQILGGAKGQFEGPTGTPWSWEIWYSSGRLNTVGTEYGNLRISSIEELLNDSLADVHAACNGGDFNVFGGTISQGCADYAGVTTHNVMWLAQQMAQANIGGNVYDLPAGPIGVAFGFEWRQTSSNFSPDAILATGDVVGFNASNPLSGGVEVAEGYGEVKVPILSGMDFFNYLGAEAGYRYSTYSFGVNTSTYKWGAEWSPIEALRFRAMVQRAIRAPSVYELYAPQNQNFPNYQDPCDAANGYLTNAQAIHLCATQFGLSDAAFTGLGFTQPNAQAESLEGGNPGLGPETAHTWTIGAVFTPGDMLGPWFRPLTATIDYYHINVRNIISSMSVSTILGRCFNDADSNPTYSSTNYYCSLFHRLATGEVWDVQATLQNLSMEKVSGIDFQVNYSLDMGDLDLPELGALAFDIRGTNLQQWALQSLPGDEFSQYRGTIAETIGSATPTWKVNFATVWSVPTPVGDVNLTWRAHMIDGMAPLNQTTANDSLGTPTIIYHDLALSVYPIEGVKIYGGINNLLDRQPPLYTGVPYSQAGIQANTDPSTYDVYGRYYFMGIVLKH